MAFRIQYKPLCEVTLRHGFHLNDGRVQFEDLPADKQKRKLADFDLFDDLRLFVSVDTQRTLSGLGCLLKATRTGFVLGTEVEPSGPPFVPVRIPDRAFRIRVVIESREPRFWNYTNTKPDRGGRVIYYLSNLVGKSGGTFPDLALPPRPYAEATEYAAGDVVSAGDDVFLAVRSGEHGAPTAADPWLKLGRHNYVSDNDHVMLQLPVFSYQPPTEMVEIVKIEAFAQDGTRFDIEAPTTMPGRPVPIDASRLAPGRYKLVVGGRDGSGDAIQDERERIYVDSELHARNVLAIVELFHLPDEIHEGFRLYDEPAGFELLQPEFFIRLLNRHTYWRYRFLKSPSDETDLGDLEKIDDEYVTRAAMPLTQGFQQVEFGEGKLLPNPSVDHIVAGVDRTYSDVHLHVNP